MKAIDTRHVFVCTNKKFHGKCCANFDAEAVFNFLKSEFNHKSHLMINPVRVKIVRASCLGQCALGPNLYITPDNIWYTYSCLEDINEIFEMHFIKGQQVERLINKGIHREKSCERA